MRNGCFCAHPYLLHLLEVPGKEAEKVRQAILKNDRRDMPGLVRVSFGIYNTKEEIDVLAAALAQIATWSYSGRYIQSTASGEYHPQGWDFEVGDYFSF